MITDGAIPWWGQWSSTVHWSCEVKKHIKFLFSQELNSRGSVGSDVHAIASGSGLHISVLSHVTVTRAGIYLASHWMVTVDPGNLLETDPNAPFMRLVNTGQPPERESEM